ncbi:hypothetical protein Tco_0132591 [Tanacetum coccineum]
MISNNDVQVQLQSETIADNVPNAMSDGDVFENPFAPPSTSAAESLSSQYVDPSNMHTFYQPYQHDINDYGSPLEQLDVWVLVPASDNIKPFTLIWLFKNKLDEENTVIRNKTRLVVRGHRQEEGIYFEERELDLLFEAMYDDYIGGQPSVAPRTAPTNQNLQTPNASTIDVDKPSQQQHVQQQDSQAPIQPETVANNVSNAMSDRNVFKNPFAPPSTNAAESSSSQYVDPSNMHTFYQPYQHDYQ